MDEPRSPKSFIRVIMSCKNAKLSHALVNRADARLDRTMAAVVRWNTWPQGILYVRSFPLESCPSLFLHSPGYSVHYSSRQQETTESGKA